MKITAIESRIIGYDVAEAWLPEGPPDGLHSTWYAYSFDAFHTDEGVVGYTMQNTNLPRWRQDGRRPALGLRARADRRGPARPSSTSGHKLRRVNRHAYNLSDGIAGVDRRRALGHRGKVAGLPIATLLGLAREKMPA